MSFVQPEFLFLFCAVFILYHSLATRRTAQNAVLLAASLFFYGWWNWSFLGLIIAESAIAYVCGLLIQARRAPKVALTFGVASLLATLCFFKYSSFILTSFYDFMDVFGDSGKRVIINVILPIGISFHTFQAIAYLVDIYRGKIHACHNTLSFAVFSVFFPQLIAGPIERASDLLRQFETPREFTVEMAAEAVWLIALGYFFKVGMADVLAPMADIGFNISNAQPSGWWVILGTLAFSLQIYGDFMGYSLIAKGIALLLGFRLQWNFIFPYWSRSISEFWRCWHVTLGRWLRDYLYIPLGGSRHGATRTALSLMVTMLLGGLWHGANWTFVLWGAWHGAALTIHHFLFRNRWRPGPVTSFLGWLSTMLVVYAGWFLFRVPDFTSAKILLAKLHHMVWFPAHTLTLMACLFYIAVIFALEALQRRLTDQSGAQLPLVARGTLVGILTIFVAATISHTKTTFIYFQF